jgi:Arc/MetJ-type ribon-helix-helix transcriptional regulator
MVFCGTTCATIAKSQMRKSSLSRWLEGIKIFALPSKITYTKPMTIRGTKSRKRNSKKNSQGFSTSIELTREQEKAIQSFVESGRYESVEAFLDEAITEAYSRTEAFKKLAREKLAASQKDIEAGRVVTVPKGKIGETLDQLHKGTLEFNK